MLNICKDKKMLLHVKEEVAEGVFWRVGVWVLTRTCSALCTYPILQGWLLQRLAQRGTFQPHTMPCPWATTSHTIPHHPTLSHAIPHDPMPSHTIPHHPMPSHTIPGCPTPSHTIQCCRRPSRAIPCHSTPSQAIPHRPTPSQRTSEKPTVTQGFKPPHPSEEEQT